ncbi:MAG: fibronectin type III domain-containing protein, partial [Acidimicrobiia bacterium]|nr:fibronectin type III domain-containing protein [Acidimicrobiia bacterium]
VVLATPVASTTGPTTVLVEGLSAGTAYTFRVEAYDQAGNQSSGGSTTVVLTLP